MKIHFGQIQDVMVEASNGWIRQTIIPTLLHFGVCPQSGVLEPTWLIEFETEVPYGRLKISYPLSKIKPCE